MPRRSLPVIRDGKDYGGAAVVIYAAGMGESRARTSIPRIALPTSRQGRERCRRGSSRAMAHEVSHVETGSKPHRLHAQQLSPRDAASCSPPSRKPRSASCSRRFTIVGCAMSWLAGKARRVVARTAHQPAAGLKHFSTNSHCAIE